MCRRPRKSPADLPPTAKLDSWRLELKSKCAPFIFSFLAPRLKRKEQLCLATLTL